MCSISLDRSQWMTYAHSLGSGCGDVICAKASALLWFFLYSKRRRGATKSEQKRREKRDRMKRVLTIGFHLLPFASLLGFRSLARRLAFASRNVFCFTLHHSEYNWQRQATNRWVSQFAWSAAAHSALFFSHFLFSLSAYVHFHRRVCRKSLSVGCFASPTSGRASTVSLCRFSCRCSIRRQLNHSTRSE